MRENEESISYTEFFGLNISYMSMSSTEMRKSGEKTGE